MFKIQKGVPVPPIDYTGLRRKYPFERMEVGDMIFVPGRSSKSLSAYISRETKNLPGTFISRHLWMREASRDEDGPNWTECTPHDEGATEGSGVWRTK